MDKLHSNQHQADVPYSATPDSVAAARAAQQRERAEFTRSTGMQLDPDGHLRRSSFRTNSLIRQPLRARQH